MFDMNDPNMFWLNVINILLGVVTLICCIVVGSSVVREILERVHARKPALAEFDDHALHVSDLGITMADGGERLGKESPLAVSNKGLTRITRTDNNDEPNITRSDS
jgi:hypothetical protein